MKCPGSPRLQEAEAGFKLSGDIPDQAPFYCAVIAGEDIHLDPLFVHIPEASIGQLHISCWTLPGHPERGQDPRLTDPLAPSPLWPAQQGLPVCSLGVSAHASAAFQVQSLTPGCSRRWLPVCTEPLLWHPVNM